jgi:hypothetical protein
MPRRQNEEDHDDNDDQDPDPGTELLDRLFGNEDEE